ncbi:MAG: hypothetical protein HYV33_02165 [Candidatus Kerfeldbacteria bacterium]|nr:hypothetical protein [Candidatus Kerfeldbacteria bacterium]
MKVATYIKLDNDVKIAAQKRSEQLGFSLSTLINAQLKQFIHADEVTFRIFTAEKMSPTLEKKLQSIDKDIKQGKNLSRSLSTAEDIDEFFRKL